MRIYTDGSCLTHGYESGGPGGWAYVCVDNGVASDVRSGYRLWTTSPRMEIEAVVRAIASIEMGVVGVTVLTDCLTVLHVIDSYSRETDEFKRGNHARPHSPDHDIWLGLIAAIAHPSVRVEYVSPKPGDEHWDHHMLVHKAAKAAAGHVNALMNKTGDGRKKKRKAPLSGWTLHDEHRLRPHLRRSA